VTSRKNEIVAHSTRPRTEQVYRPVLPVDLLGLGVSGRPS